MGGDVLSTASSKNHKKLGGAAKRPGDFSQNLEAQVQLIGRYLLSQAGGTSFLNKNWWFEKVLEASMKNSHFKTQMFRFVDVFASLKTGDEMMRHLHEYLAQDGRLPSWLQLGHKLGSLLPQTAARVLQKNMQSMAKVFIAGQSPQQITPYLQASRSRKIGFTVDVLDEATLSEHEALQNQKTYLNLITQLAAVDWPYQKQLDVMHRGVCPAAQVSIKLSALYSQIHSHAFEHTVQVLKQRLRPIFRLAQQKAVFVNVDMERYEHKSITMQVFSDLLQEAEFCKNPYFGVVVQTYLREAVLDVKYWIQLAQQRGTPLGIRLVKGAYWDYESIYAEQQHWPSPVWLNKFETDLCFEQALHLLIDHTEHIHLAVASHNVRSIAVAMALLQEREQPRSAIEFQMLYGMAQALKPVLVQQGWRVREYVTMGEAIPGMSYLVRRLLENTSNEGFISSTFNKQSPEVLLANPFVKLQNFQKQGEKNMPSQESPAPFKNEALLDWNIKPHREQMQKSLNEFKKGQVYSLQEEQVLIEAGVEQGTKPSSSHLLRYDPSNTQQAFAYVKTTSLNEAEKMVQRAGQAQPAWQALSVGLRCQLINELADELLSQRFDLMACIVLESGKSWPEADGDVGEAIDFCRYYAVQMQQFAEGRQVSDVPGEDSRIYYEAYGVSVVIAPWNFPLAILTGMTAASLITGHTVIMKPAEQSSVIAYKLYQAWQKVVGRHLQLPPHVLQLACGYGHEVGQYLSRHKDVHLINFTGSREVGLQILNNLATPTHIKQAVVEMGGKNALIIDEDADVDEAVTGAVHSAFGFQGQKCSACSRIMVLKNVWPVFLKRFVEATKSLQQGPSCAPEFQLGPVVDEEAFNRLNKKIKQYANEVPMVYQGPQVRGGWFVPPTIFAPVPVDHELGRDELFGPVVALMKVDNLQKAIEATNNSVYALTGGVYSRSPSNIDLVRRTLNVGNLYINRSITGAIVGRHPFGGHKMSGLGDKTGGPHTLLQYMRGRVITENTVRRGFTP